MSGQVLYRRFSFDYPTVDYGEGVYLYDVEGRRYLDAAGGALVVNVGHGVADIVDAMAAQGHRVAFVHGTQFNSQAMEDYARALGEVSSIPDPRIFLVSGGSEAVETAIKLARQVWVARGEAGRYKIISRWGSYHGATLGALSASGQVKPRMPYAPLLADFPHIPPAYCYRCPFSATYPGCDLACAAALEGEILRQGPGSVAAFIAEPVVGATLPAAVPPAGYWPRVRQICNRYGVLLIADEVMTGMGRTGRWFAIDHWDVTPDVLVTAKGASGGYWPLGVILVRPELVDQLRAGAGGFVHGFTHANSVMAATVGLSVLRYIQARDLVAVCEQRGRYLRQALSTLADLPVVGDVRGLGLMVGVEVVADRASNEPFPPERGVAARIQEAAMARGAIVYPMPGLRDGRDGDGVLIGPPFVITEAQLDELADILRQAIVEATGL